jgi:hypothetical protein
VIARPWQNGSTGQTLKIRVTYRFSYPLEKFQEFYCLATTVYLANTSQGCPIPLLMR